jgi:MoaA/NifB/PqqE/SkfB family radical SAM enzyme
MAIRTVFHLELTDNCNFNCVFCKTVRRQTKSYLDFDTGVKALNVVKDTPIYGIYLNSVQLNGSGEALLYPRLAEMIVECRKRFSMCEFVTNAFLLTEKKCIEILNTDIDMIEISRTGITPEVYKNFQGSGISYEQCEKNLSTVIRNVKMLAKKRDEMSKDTYIRLRYIRSRELGSNDHLREYINFWKNTGVDEIFVTALWDFARKRKGGNKKFKIIRCHCMNSPFKVNADGNIFSCANNHDAARYTVGNVYETPLDEIIMSEKFVKDKAAKMTCDINVVPKTCLSCECRQLRDFTEEIINMRRRIFLRKPLKNLIYKLFGFAVLAYERLNRRQWFFDIFWNKMKKDTKRLHDEFNLKHERNAGEKRI